MNSQTTLQDFSLPLLPPPNSLRAILDAVLARPVHLAGMIVTIPGTLKIRLSVVLSNLRMHRMLDALLFPGETAVDVGANIGYNTLYAAHRVGALGRVFALEPAQDNLRVLYQNLSQNSLRNVLVLPYAAGNAHAVKRFYLRGEVSAVNSLFQDNFYHPITETVEVLSEPLDNLLFAPPKLVKIDVEGGELEVLQGMRDILSAHSPRLIVEWHPVLQQAAGHEPDALPRHLLGLGFSVQVVTHSATATLTATSLPSFTRQLLVKRSPVELLAQR